MKIKEFDSLKITLASPEQILSWSHGEVKKAETINYRTQRAEVDGLMCERIFGPTKNYECYCGKYQKIRYKGIVCDKCGVEVTHKRVRRERLGHIKLAAPVTHVWFAYGLPNKMSLVLGVPQKELESVIYFARYIVIETDLEKKLEAMKRIDDLKKEQLDTLAEELAGELSQIDEEMNTEIDKLKEQFRGKKDAFDLQKEQTKFKFRQKSAKVRESFGRKEQKILEESKRIYDIVKNIDVGKTLSEDEFNLIIDNEIPLFFEIKMGAEGLRYLLKKIDLGVIITELREELQSKSRQRRAKAIQRLRVVEGMHKNSVRPEWMILDVLPVISPELRPIIMLPGGRFATSDLNDLYRRVINRNNRLKRLIDLGAPEIILRNEKRMLQEAVDALFDNSHRPGRPVMNSRRQPYKSIADMLRGKRGRFRQNLLGKRVDYSARSVIVGGPDLKLDQCGIPNLVALELFKPFVIREIILRGLAPNIKAAKNFFEKKSSEVWDILAEVIKERPVLLNRAPTLHKQGIQAFYPVLTDGNAIRICPLICKGFNADFDGDQMAIHVPLSRQSVEEAKTKMMAKQNILRMADASPVVSADQDMVLGNYYLTGTNEDSKDYTKRTYRDTKELVGELDKGHVGLRDMVSVRINGEIIQTTPGRVIFNEFLPEGMDFVNEQVDKDKIKKIVAYCLGKYDQDTVAETLDNLKEYGFKYATISGFTVGMDDLIISKNREKYIEDANAKDEELMGSYYSGLITLNERKSLSQQNWLEVTDKVAEDTWSVYDTENPLFWLEDSGARPVKNPTRQISGIRGLILDAVGKVVDLPLKSNFKIGLNSFEYFVGSKSTRKGLADTALKTAESGYLTRRLVDVSQDLIIKEEDCGNTKVGFTINRNDDRRIEFESRITGRWSVGKIVDPKTNKTIVKADEEITPELAALINESEIESVVVRSPLTCKLRYGICKKCYGYDLGTQKLVEIGEAVGVIAAQAMGEAATQLTLDTKHLAGRVGTDITQGLPRVEELFEARSPKGQSIIAEIDGIVKYIRNDKDEIEKVRIVSTNKDEKIIKLLKSDIPSFKRAKKIKKGDVLYTSVKKGEVKAEESGRVSLIDGGILLEKEGIVEVDHDITSEMKIIVEEGDSVIKGTQLTAGSVDPKMLQEYMGKYEASKYVIDEVQKVYGSQGISINDKHVELVVRQMGKYVRILAPGDSTYLHGELVDFIAIKEENDKLKAAGKDIVKYDQKLVGITTSAIKTESFLSAASFEQQVRVLTDAALLGRVDNLRGLKENVIIGKLVPLGSVVNKGKKTLEVEPEAKEESEVGKQPEVSKDEEKDENIKIPIIKEEIE